MTRWTILLALAVALGLPIGAAAASGDDARDKPRRAGRVSTAVVRPAPARPDASGPAEIEAALVECVDPEVGDPPSPAQSPRSRADTGDAPTAPVRAVSVRRVAAPPSEPISFQASQAGSQLAPDPGTSCRARAVYEFHRDGAVLPNLPPVSFPEQPCQDRSRCVETTKSWMRTHFNVWIARQVIEYIAAQDHVEKRRYLWSRPGVKDGDPLSDKTSPEYWFGAYSDERFRAVREGIDDLWKVVTTAKTGGIAVHLECPTKLQEPNNVCYTAKPAAHHWVKGHVDLCPAFYDADRADADRSRLMTHELMHHLWIKQGKVWVAIQDKHYHGHGTGCGLSPGSESAYGEDRIRHLATYRNSNGNDCGHLVRNARNNDTYAYFITTMGDAVYRGRMTHWPAQAEPTPLPPKCVGDEGCLCDDRDTWPLNAYFEPDGDFSPDQWCADNDGETTCMAKRFGSQTRGVCTKCDQVRGAGCECDAGRPCQQGSCFGADTFGGGTGHCFDTQDPPSWACLADCSRLYNDQAAWCYADYPTGTARCMDDLCTEPKAWECAQQGKVCRYGDCVVECASSADCQAKGYPSTFGCQQSRCEHGA